MARNLNKPAKKHRIRLNVEPQKNEASSETQRVVGLLKIPVPPPPKGLSTKDAARDLGISPVTLANWRVRGTGPKFHRFGSRIIYSREALDEYREAHTYSSTAEADRAKK